MRAITSDEKASIYTYSERGEVCVLACFVSPYCVKKYGTPYFAKKCERPYFAKKYEKTLAKKSS
jgi:hypothetical protein